MLLPRSIRSRNLHFFLILLLLFIFASSIDDDPHHIYSLAFGVFSQEDTEYLSCLHKTIHKGGRCSVSSDTLDEPAPSETYKAEVRLLLNDFRRTLVSCIYTLSHPYRAPPGTPSKKT